MKKEMKEKIKEIEAYFINRLVEGNYTVDKFEAHFVKVDVDGYKFTLWTSNGAKFTSTHESSYNFMDLDFTEEQKKSIYEDNCKKRSDFYEKVQREIDEKELKRLTEKLKR